MTALPGPNDDARAYPVSCTVRRPLYVQMGHSWLLRWAATAAVAEDVTSVLHHSMSCSAVVATGRDDGLGMLAFELGQTGDGQGNCVVLPSCSSVARHGRCKNWAELGVACC